MQHTKSGRAGTGSRPVVVVKVGTSSLIRADKNALNLTSLAGIVEMVRDLRSDGYDVVLVSSGAVGVGCQRLGLTSRPAGLPDKQALAAVGQVHLMRYYDDLFSACGLTCAQVLLTLDNLANRGQYLNAANTFHSLLRYGVTPIVNENDTVAVEQLRIGDNDTLSAQVANLVQADWLFLLTDVDALYTSNPSVDPAARPIHEVQDLWSLAVDTSTSGTQWGTGGMATKLTAARMATAGGCNMAICHFAQPANVLSILGGERVGTVFHAASAPARGRKRWLLSVQVKGELWLDAGAVRAVRDRHCSLFSAGIVRADGAFEPQDAVRLCDGEGREFARGLSNYGSEDVDSVKGMSSRAFLRQLGSSYGQEEIVHRANICMLVNAQQAGALNGDAAAAPEIEESEDDDYGLSPAGISRAGTPAFGRPVGSPGLLSSVAHGDADDIAARLAALQQRMEAEEASWLAEAVEAAALERDSDVSPAGMHGSGSGLLPVQEEEEVTEAGWLPR